MEQGEIAHSTVVPKGQVKTRIPDEGVALNDAATKLLTKRTPTLSVAEAIEAHRSAMDALNAACPGIDRVLVAKAGGDTSDEGMSSAQATWTVANQAEVDALNALLAVRPSSSTDLAKMIGYLAGSGALNNIDAQGEGIENLAAAAEAVVAAQRDRTSLASLSPHSSCSPKDLADACDWAVRHVAWMNAACRGEAWDDTRLGAEADKSGAVWRRAASEPATDLRTAAAKARMFLAEWDEEVADESIDHGTDDRDRVVARLARDVVGLFEREVAPACTTETGTRADLTDEAVELSITIGNLKRLSNIAKVICGGALECRLPPGTNIKVSTRGTDAHAHFLLTNDQVNDLSFIVEHVNDVARAADDQFEALEKVLTFHSVVREEKAPIK